MRAFLNQVPRGTYRAEDFLDDDGISTKPVKIAVTLRFGGRSEQGETGRETVCQTSGYGGLYRDRSASRRERERC